MQCIKCGEKLPEGVAFCPYCGTRVADAGRGEDKPLYQTEVKGLLKSGRLAVYRDRVEFSSSSAQKTTFTYDTLVAVKKRLLPTPAILFITEDGRTESCTATSKNVHEAFLHVEQAVKPYIEARKERLLCQGIRYSLVSSMGMTNGGVLNISEDRAEFQSKSGQKKIVPYQSVKSAAISGGGVEFFLFDGKALSFAVEKELRDEVLDFVKGAIAPYLEQRKRELLEQGIYYSCFSRLGQEAGTLNLFADRAEFTGRSGQTDAAAFENVRTARLYGEMLELAMTDGTLRAYAVDRDEQNEMLEFVKRAIEPYVQRRTVGFEAAFGDVEKLEINPERGVYHIIRQSGAAITDERPLADVVKCQLVESNELNPMISGIRLKTIASAAEEGDMVRAIDVVLTVQDGGEQRIETVRLGNFPLGISRTSPKYGQYAASMARLTDYLRENWPSCELILPAPPAPKPAERAALEAGAAAGVELYKSDPVSEEGAERFGMQKYIKWITEYISTCHTPVAVAFQGNSDSGEGNVVKMLSGSLEKQYRKNLIYLHARHLLRSNLKEKLPTLIGASLVSQLGGPSDGRGVKFAKASLNLAVAVITQGNLDGQPLTDALFENNTAGPPEDMAIAFADLVEKRRKSETDKVVVVVDGMDALPPAKVVEGLEAMEDFFNCDGCVFAIAMDYAAVLQGIKERGQSENDARAFFDKIFRVSFRLPQTSFDLEGYVKSQLGRIGADGDGEVEPCCRLLERSVGSAPDSVGHLFDSFQLLRTMAGRELFESRRKRMILFGLLCMQTRFRKVYDRLVQIRSTVTPELIMGLCEKQSDVVARSGLAEEDRDSFSRFAQVFCGILNADNMEGISQEECAVFTEVLEVSSIISR